MQLLTRVLAFGNVNTSETMQSILAANCVEAVIGAVTVDQGAPAALAFAKVKCRVPSRFSCNASLSFLFVSSK